MINAREVVSEDYRLKDIRKNSIYLEILGNGAVYSINYDRIVPFKEDVAMFVRLGGNEYHGIKTDQPSYNFLGVAGILYGGPKSFIEAGLGYTHFSGSSDRLVVLATGYRFHGRKGLVFRATPMYIYNSEKGDTFGNSLWIGLSIGFSF
jgi:hypothetical protein